jgi:hypothetical protein
VQRFQTNLSHHFSEQEAVLITAAASVAALIFAEGPEYFSDAVVFVEDATIKFSNGAGAGSFGRMCIYSMRRTKSYHSFHHPQQRLSLGSCQVAFPSLISREQW